jgi:uncharacterized protein YcnI
VTHTYRSGLRRTAVILTAAGLGLLATALPASAHVTISPNTAAQGGSDTDLTFRVPDEEANASTTTLQVTFPVDHPVTSVLVQPIAGWTATVQNTTLATPITTDDGTITQVVSQVTWTGGNIQPGQYQGFHVIMGLLPKDTGQIVFKAVQTYSNGDVVRWIDLAQPGQPAPDHPAPVLTLTAPGTGSAAPTSASPTVTAAPTATNTTKASSANDSTARGLGIGGLAAGLIGIAFAVFATVRSRRVGTSSS